MRQSYTKKLMLAVYKTAGMGMVLSLFSVTFPAMAQCQISVDQSQLDYGTVGRGQLRTEKDYKLSVGHRSFNVHVQCPQPRRLAVAYRGDTQDGEFYAFGSGSARITLTASDALADGVPVALHFGARSAFPHWDDSALAGLPLHPLSRNMIYPIGPALSQLSFQITAEAWLLARAISRGEGIHLNGMGTFDVMEYE
ncbi:hypothetical protein DJ39_183 [Yersinia ruckeri ATCC 29473]|uniref:Beta-fimbriae major subunit n=2 Tax=Yersinia ruckeri TaxID=29486 RepID=A0A380QQV2_YERRU|nr:hypothetical protein QMA0440_03198 [Yersinia ruckeri]KGA50294.1 hypothetical protein DJ39_183 [Yersinia ruckeri ATCC 29473]KFE39808.1 hypothetical protein nADLYRO1b_840 [Yersinia ruckeri]CNI57732.1 Uncharacterised protein [Yersinia ruckeri]SUP96186.1 Uncharacterised protein [Yersinia ruckeri]